MSEDQHNSNEDLDSSNLEHGLYASIHYEDDNNGGINEAIRTTENPAQHPNSRRPSSDSHNSTPHRNTKRYWTPNQGAAPVSHNSAFGPKGRHPKARYGQSPNVAAVDNSVMGQSEIEQSASPFFLPYVSMLSSAPSSPNRSESPMDNNSQSDNGALAATKKLLETKAQKKNINPFNKQHTAKQHKETTNIANVSSNNVNTNTSSDIGQTKSKKRLNPFAQQQLQKAKKDKKSGVKDRPGKNKGKNNSKSNASSDCVIDLDETNDDDDVIILPTVEPPLICVDSSDDELDKTNDHAFAEPATITSDGRKTKATGGSRCPSPTSSIQSTDDFIVQQDRHNINFDANLSYDDVYSGNETVADSLRQSDRCASSTSNSIFSNETVVFTAPQTTSTDKSRDSSSRQSYEVSDNSFVAVDVYESESSDMPDSIYAKGNAMKRKIDSDSDSSGLNNITVFKPKKLKKRKYSGSAKEMSDDSSSDLPGDDDSSSDNDSADDRGDSYLVRGEALGKVRKSGKKNKSKCRKKSLSGKSSDDEFMMKLTSIVNDNTESDNDDADDHDPETSTEVVDARHIVETVLERRTKRLNANKTNASEENIESAASTAATTSNVAEKESEERVGENDKVTNAQIDETKNKVGQGENANVQNLANDKDGWAVTDEVGETDDMPSFPSQNSSTEISSDAVECIPSDNTSQEISALEVATPKPAKQLTNDKAAVQTTDASRNRRSKTPNVIVEEIHAESGWNDEMKRFYNDSWGGETFSVRSVHSRMSKSGIHWKLGERDRHGYNNRRNPNIVCLNCQERGHKAVNCYKPPAKKRCSMCGIEGHAQSRCPNKICLSCGRKMLNFTTWCPDCSRERSRSCYVCKERGHLQSACPDFWRRYHAITSVNQPLDPKQGKPTSSKAKYCSLCSRRGHLAEKCLNVKAKYPIASSQVVHYRPIYNVNNASQYNDPRKFTILTSSLDNYTFNYGDAVANEGNRIYARFRRAVNLNEPHDEENAFDESIAFLESSRNEYNAPDSSVDFETSAMTEAAEWLGDTSQNISAIEVVESDQSSQSIEGQNNDSQRASLADDDQMERNEASQNNPAVLDYWQQKYQTLSDIRAKLLDTQMTETNESEPIVHRDEKDESDSNYSFSEHFSSSATKTLPASTTPNPNHLPDFIPLPESRERSRSRSRSPTRSGSRSRSPSAVSADTTTDSVVGDTNCDATIHLTQTHCNQLIKPHGSAALRELETTHSVTVEMEWRSMGNVLRVHGTPENQDKFHAALTALLTTLTQGANNSQPNNTMLRLPKQRGMLINCLREHLRLLDTPSYYNRDLRKIHRTMVISLGNNTKRGTKEAYRCRRILNAVLFGRCGFSDGEMHLMGIQNFFGKMVKTKTYNLNKGEFADLGKHFEYIFTEFDHKNYPDLLDQYYNMKEAKSLRALPIDRQLLGFNINVSSSNETNTAVAAASTTATKPRLSLSNGLDDLALVSTSTQSNTLPAADDIQLNVSNSSMNF